MSVSLAAIAAIGSLVASGVGAGLSAKANSEARAKLAADREEDRRYYDRLLNRDYVNSSENQSLLRRLREMQKENYNRARATNVVAGGTDAHLAAMQQSNNKVVTDTANAIASRADAYKDRVSQAKRASEKAYSQQMFGLDMQKSQNIANAAGQASSAMAGIASAAGGSENPFKSTAAVDSSAPQAKPAATVEATTPAVQAVTQPATTSEAIQKVLQMEEALRAFGVTS